MKRFFTLLSLSLFLFSVSFSDVIMEPEMFDDIQSDGIVTDEKAEDTENQIITDKKIVTTSESTWQSNIDAELKDIDPSDNWLGLIHFWFCNEWNDNLSSNLNYAVTAWTPFKVCSMFYNGSNQDIKIEVRIVDQEKTAEWDPTCNYVSTNIQNFINPEVLADFEEIVLPAWETVTKEFDVTFPLWVEWDQKACYTYYIPRESQWWMITAIINKASFMDFFVGTLDDIKNEITATNITTSIDDNKDLQMDFVLSNVGNLEDSITIKWQITNILWFKKEFEIEWKWIQLTPGSSVPVSAKLWSLPGYGWLFKIEFTATATPFFSYDVSHSTIDPSLLEDKTFTVTTTYFQMPWLILIVLVLVIVILFLAFRKPKNKAQPQVVYVQVPQQPTQPTAQPQQPQIPQQ